VVLIKKYSCSFHAPHCSRALAKRPAHQQQREKKLAMMKMAVPVIAVRATVALMTVVRATVALVTVASATTAALMLRRSTAAPAYSTAVYVTATAARIAVTMRPAVKSAPRIAGTTMTAASMPSSAVG
jgi:hypothetical protein